MTTAGRGGSPFDEGEKLQPPADLVVSDAAKRISEAMTLHTLAGSAGKWASFRMSDGREVQPGTAYDSHYDAMRHAKWDRDTTVYLEIPPDGIPEAEAQGLLQYARQLHDAGFRIPAPDFSYDPTMPLLQADRDKTIRHLARANRRGRRR